jgi:hypothetical protein
MVFNSNGAVISGITRADYSTLRDDYIVMWDETGCPIHIKRSIIEYLHSIPVRHVTIPQLPINENDVFI